MDINSTSGSRATTTDLYLVRHGETEYNRRNVVQGAGVDSAINDTGRAQAEALARRFASVGVDRVYASTLRRARQTAGIVARPHQPVTTTYLPELEEMQWGVFEGEPPSEDRDAAMGAIKERWRAGEYDYAVEGGESIRDVEGRARRALDQIVSRERGGTVVVVTHGRYLRVLLGSALSAYSLDDMHALDHSNTCVNRVRYRQGEFRADLLNCTAHLSASAAA